MLGGGKLWHSAPPGVTEGETRCRVVEGAPEPEALGFLRRSVVLSETVGRPQLRPLDLPRLPFAFAAPMCLTNTQCQMQRGGHEETAWGFLGLFWGGGSVQGRPAALLGHSFDNGLVPAPQR